MALKDPKLTENQQKTIEIASDNQLQAWMNELYPGYSNLEIKRLYEYLNKVRLQEMVSKSNSPHKPLKRLSAPKLIRVECVECGREVQIPVGAVAYCQHCNCPLYKYEKWRHKK